MSKVILIHDVPNLGAAGEVVEVKPGYARNYLIPRKFAVRWTKGAQTQIDQMAEARRRREIATVEEAHAVREKLAGKTVTVSKMASGTGRLFGSVSANEIAEAIKTQCGQTVDHRKIVAESVIRTIGNHNVTVGLQKDVAVDIKVLVEAAARKA